MTGCGCCGADADAVPCPQVLKETLRVYPTIPGTRRWLQRPCVIDGIHIPAPVSVILSTYIMGRMAKFFDDPLRFDPERFSPDAPKPYYCYFPFALGPRSCLGQVFAQVSGWSLGVGECKCVCV
uniref:Uncharacterized protein n=1 Tax=Callorhinchus milii TaxID=7868 RepID=A0A4W3GCY5_CALMI